MAGGKETPRQKMIGMMYLVLTALLALNVSKQIVAAFVTINDKLDASSTIINNKTSDTYFGFSQKRAALNALNGNTDKLDLWESKATELKFKTRGIVSFLLGECNDMIKEAEGEDWIEEKDSAGNILSLKSLMKIQNMDNYDIPTNMFVGGNPNQPNEKGMNISEQIHEFRNAVCHLMGSYKEGSMQFEFSAPENKMGLTEAFKQANPKDTAKLRQVYEALTIPDLIPSHEDEETMMPWAAVMFDHAPIVAAAALFTSLKLDIRNAETMVAEFMLAKVDAPLFNFNKIEPLPFARTSYINQGDSLSLDVLIAAIDTNNVAKIRYGIDDSIPTNWVTTTGGIGLNSQTPGPHFVRGQIGVEQQGEITWKDWGFNYTVGQPMGVVSLPENNILYKGYEMEVVGTASGFPQERITMKGTNCRITKRGGKFYVVPTGNSRSASITVYGSQEDGTSVNLGTTNYSVRRLPKPTLFLGGFEDGSSLSPGQLRSATGVYLKYDPSITLDVTFRVSKYTATLSSAPRPEKSGNYSVPTNVKGMFNNARVGNTVTIMAEYTDPSGTVGKVSGSFTIR